MINYLYPLYRPPAEANNIIIQITYGCSYNNCSFCSMYKDKKYKLRDIKEVFKDIDTLSKLYPKANKVFLADGDALSVPTDYLLKILKYLNDVFTNLRRVSVYASTQNIFNKSSDELDLLYSNKLKLIYYGIESGNNIVLEKINKGVDSKQIIDSLVKVSKSKIKISATIILGIGGKQYTNEHIKDTANIINNTTINYLSTLQLGLDKSIEAQFYKNFNEFIPLCDIEILDEQKRFIELTNPINKVIFRSNHASNALHLAGTIPKDKNRLLKELKTALSIGQDAFIPNIFRGF